MKILGGYSKRDEICLEKNGIVARAYLEKGVIQKDIHFYLDSTKEYSEKYSMISIIAVITEVINVILYITKASYKLSLIPLVIIASLIFLNLVYDLKNQEVRMNHAAEHMVINYINMYGENPTLIELKKESRFSKRCNSIILPLYFIIELLKVIILYKYNIIIPELFVYTLLKGISFMFPFYFLNYLVQLISTKKPEEKNLKLAKSAIDVMYEYKTNMENLKFSDAQYVIHEQESEIDKKLLKRTEEIYREKIKEL